MCEDFTSHRWIPLTKASDMIKHDIVQITAVTEAEYEYKFEPTKDTPYLTWTGELLGVFCDGFGENLQHLNGIRL